MDSGNMFWGVVLKPEKRYEQMVEEPFHISMACIEPTTSGKGSITSVFVEVDDEEFIICNFSEQILNNNLDLNFNSGDKIVFKTSGTGVVHLTGYNITNDDEMEYEDDSDLEDEESETEEVPALMNGKKRKLSAGDQEDMPSKKANKKEPSPLDKLLADKKKSASPDGKKAEIKKAEAMKKILEAEKKKKQDSDDEEDSDEEESDDDVEDLEAEEDGEEESDDDEEAEEEESEEESDDDDEMDVDKSVLTPSKSPKDAKNEKKKQQEKPQMNGKKQEKKPETPAKSGSDQESPASQKKKNKKNKNKNKENGGDASNTSNEKTPQKPGADQKTPQKGPQTPGKGQQTPGKTPKKTLKGGIVAEDLKVGTGPEAKRGKMVGMYYEGKLKSNNKTFDSTLNGKPFRFRLGTGEVIKGWDIGIEGMKVGGKRRLTIPPQMAYGSKGAGSDIPPNSHLVFDVECKAIN